ncbi:MAG: CHASE2 domain-containing protein, partial [Bacteriovoracaceae bacterium]|nr:CHASE2 domain-containing protein [Bacteriovoracaceae bacterium]
TVPKIFQDLPQLFAVINADENIFAQDKVVRRALLQAGQEQALHLQVANDLRTSLGQNSLSVEQVRGQTYLPNTDASYFLLRLGKASNLLQLGQAATFFEVINGRFYLPEWEHKIVLIGPSYEKRHGDFVKTPLYRQHASWPKIFLHGQIMAALAQNKGTVALASGWAVAGMLFFAAILIWVILKRRPFHSLNWIVLLMGIVLLIDVLLFSGLGLWISPVAALLMLLLVYFIWMPFRAVLEYQGRTAVEEEAKMWQELEGLKRNFISLMSHDLKTPIAKVASLAEVLQHQVSDQEDARKNVQAILKTTKDLNQFISVILDLAKAEAKSWKVQQEHKDLNQLIEKMIKHYQQDLGAAQMQWSLDLAPLYPIEMDEALMQRVLANLVENAIRYAGAGKTLMISTKEEGEWVYATVADNGPGIKEEDLPYIFDKFYRGQHPTGKGTGLGLYLVKYFVELLGGKIKVESHWGVGTAFILQMPNR